MTQSSSIKSWLTTTTHRPDSHRTSASGTARLAGALYLSLPLFGFFSFVYVPSALFVRGDAGATSRNIMASEGLFRAGIVSHLISQVIVVFLLLALYRLLEPVNRNHAVLMALLGIAGIPISFLAEVNNLAALRLLGGADDGAFTPAQIQTQAMLFLDLHRSGVLVAQLFWGLWLLPLAALVFRSGFLPRPLALAVLIAAAGYLVDSGAHLLFPGLPVISRFTFFGELLLPLWLLFKGVTEGRPAVRVIEREGGR